MAKGCTAGSALRAVPDHHLTRRPQGRFHRHCLWTSWKMWSSRWREVSVTWQCGGCSSRWVLQLINRSASARVLTGHSKLYWKLSNEFFGIALVVAWIGRRAGSDGISSRFDGKSKTLMAPLLLVVLPSVDSAKSISWVLIFSKFSILTRVLHPSMFNTAYLCSVLH